MIEIKTDNGHYIEIYDTEFKILERPNGSLWNTDVDHPIAVDKARFEKGDYVSSEEKAEPIVDEVEEEPREQEVVDEENEEELFVEE